MTNNEPTNFSIKSWAEEDRPREKLMLKGKQNLSDAELLALFIGNGMHGENAIQLGQRILNTHQSLSALAKLNSKQLSKEKGIGPAKSTLIAAACEMGKRISKQEVTKLPLKSPEIIYDLISPLFANLSIEVVYVLAVDTKLMCIKQVEISSGTVNQSICHPRDILHPVITHQAHGFILVHNHPSGDPTPSKADHQITKAIKEAAHLMQVKFHDHVIIGSHSKKNTSPFYSFRQSGNL